MMAVFPVRVRVKDFNFLLKMFSTQNHFPSPRQDPLDYVYYTVVFGYSIYIGYSISGLVQFSSAKINNQNCIFL